MKMNNNVIWFLGVLLLLVVAWAVYRGNLKKATTNSSTAIQASAQVPGLEVATEMGRIGAEQIYTGPIMVNEPPNPMTNTPFGGVRYSSVEEWLARGGIMKTLEIQPTEPINQS